MRVFIILLLSSFLLVLCTNGSEKEPKSNQTAENKSNYVGAESCKSCHQEAYDDWKKSDHFFSMQKATEEYVKADFNTTYFADGIQYKFYTQDASYFVEISDQNIPAQTYEVTYTFGWEPLQQYLLKSKKGRFQTLRASWDTEKNVWFHQSAGTIVEPHDWLSWSRGGQNWNTMCSSCHSTHLKKNYNEETDSFHTTFKEINVACETCHGAGKLHIDAQEDKNVSDPYKNKKLEEQKIQVDVCGTCHARRTMLEDLNDPSDIFLQRFISQTLTSSFYEADGQILEEDFVYASFLSSKMYQKGVKCNDCHNSHTGLVKIKGNNLCLQCHKPKYNGIEHHFHKENSEGAQCINCHMDGKVYMGNDYRKDHSFRVPRPDQSVHFGTSNSCNSCHKDKNAKWAATQVVNWYGTERTYHFSDDLIPASALDEMSFAHIENLMIKDSIPVIVQATALNYLRYLNHPKTLELILKALKHNEAFVRQAGYEALLTFPEEIRVQPGMKGITDPIKAVRIMAFRTVISADVSQFSEDVVSQWNSAKDEYIIYLQGNADFPTGQTLIGEYYQELGNTEKAITAFERALILDSLLVSPYTNLAILHSGNNQPAIVKGVLQKGLKHFPENAEFYYFLGLNEGALGSPQRQLEFLKAAYDLQPENPKYSYNYILSEYNYGNKKDAQNDLLDALKNNPLHEGLQELKVYFSREGNLNH